MSLTIDDGKYNDRILNEQVSHIDKVFQGKKPHDLVGLFNNSLTSLNGNKIDGITTRIMPNKEYERQINIRIRLQKKIEQRNKK